MSNRLLLYTKTLGFANGLKLYFHGKKKGESALQLSILKHPVYFRGINSDKFMFRQIFIKREYDFKVNSNPKVIFDLGANVGYASIYFANRFPEAKIIALEPDESNYDLAKKNVANYKNITLLRGAVWHKNEKINVVDKGYGKAGMVVEPGDSNDAVESYTVSDLMKLANVTEIDLIKIDIEGAEKEIFEVGYEDWVPHSRMIVVETHDRFKDGTSKAVFSTISKYDFSLELCGENFVLYNEKFSPGFTKYIPEANQKS